MRITSPGRLSPMQGVAARARRVKAYRSALGSRVGMLVWIVAAIGCRRGGTHDSALPRVRVELEFAGCATLRSGPRCVLAEDRTVRLFVPEAPRWNVGVEPGGREPDVRRELRSDGVVYYVTIPGGARRLELCDPSGSRSFELRLEEPQPTAALQEAKQLRARGEFAKARARIGEALPELAPELAGRARALLARLALSEGDVDAAVVGLRESLEEAYQHGRISDATEDATALAYLLCMNVRDYAAARGVLERAGRSCRQDPSARALLPYYEALLERETGDLRRALELFRSAIERSERLQLEEHASFAREEYASTLAFLGRHEQAVAEQERIVAAFHSDDACKLADRQETIAWYALLAEPEPESALASKAARASELAGRTLARCRSAWRLRNHRINAALLALQRADAAAAQSELSALPALEQPDPVLEAWEHEARGRLALAQRRAKDALRAFESAHGVAKRVALWENQHLALLGEARALDALGRADQALARYRQAEVLLDEALGFVPLSAGQAGFQHAREAGTEELVALALREGSTELALDCARTARNRSLRALSRDAVVAQLDAARRPKWQSALARYRTEREALELGQAEAWRMPADRLAAHERTLEQRRRAAQAALEAAYAVLARARLPPTARLQLEPGDVVLAYFPSAHGVRAFLVRSGETRALELPALEASQATAQQLAALVQPFRQALTRRDEPSSSTVRGRLRLIMPAAFAHLDFHAVEFEGEPLGALLPVSYELDLATQSDAAQPSAATASGCADEAVLIVGNPTGDLVGAEAEARQIAALFPGVPPLLRAAASRARVGEALSRAEQFHFAGHARYAGLEGVDSALRLADGELTLGEILNLPHVPSRVVLSACESARSAGPGYTSGLGIAQAFVAAGAREVIASTRPIADDQARIVLARVYEELGRAPQTSASQALQRAVRALRGTQPALDLAAFRVLTP